MKIRSEKHMKESGWVKDANGTWVAPHEKGIQVARYDANGKKERINIVEVRTEIGGHRDDDEPLGPGWIKVPVPDKGAQVAAFIRAGLSTKEAELAANPSKLFRGR
jgi:hypothetical protein